MRKICVVTGTRAEYGLLRWVMEGIQQSPKLELQIIATGMHLSPEFGLTYREIEKDGFHIDRKVEMLLSADTPSSIAKSTGLGMIGFADALTDLQPHVVMLLGDRYELMAAAIAALVARIPIAHIHGGETTVGAFDESIRHSVTKMAWWHFVAAKEYEKRVIQLGEGPKRIFNVGGLGVDSIKKAKLLLKDELAKKTGIQFDKKSLLVTYHPVTLEHNTAQKQFQTLLNVLNELKDIQLIFTMPNADSDSRIIRSMIDEFVSSQRNRAMAFASMGHLNYLSSLQFMDGVVGNSSSGLTEAPTFKIGTVNIGDRQKGRLRASSVIDCDPTRGSIEKAIRTLFSDEFRSTLSTTRNPYEGVNASGEILDILENEPLPEEPKKEFYDL
jgi:GDP/UDP-N,N'-diacetylbacillosamine 2-epimerase (hydrolysing)